MLRRYCFAGLEKELNNVRFVMDTDSNMVGMCFVVRVLKFDEELMASKRIKISVDNAWDAAIRRAAGKRSQTVSDWVRYCIARNLSKQEQSKLKEIKVGRPKTK